MEQFTAALLQQRHDMVYHDHNGRGLYALALPMLHLIHQKEQRIPRTLQIFHHGGKHVG